MSSDPSEPRLQPAFDRTPGRVVVVAMLFLFATMLFCLLALTLPPYGPAYSLVMGIAALCGFAWTMLLLIGIAMCAANPPPRAEPQDGPDGRRTSDP